MPAEYRLVIQGPADHTFVFMPEVSIRDVERRHRRGVNPNVLVLVRREIEVTAEFRGTATTPDTLQAAFSTFMSNHVSARTVPTFIEIRDAVTSTPIPDIGVLRSITDGGDWEELQLTSFVMDPAEDQMKGNARFRLILQGVRVFADTNDVVVLDQERNVEGGPDGLPRVTLTTTIRTIQGVNVASKATLMREPAPSGWVRQPPSNNSDGIGVRYTNWPLTNEAVVTSIVKQLGGGVVLPSGASDGTITDRLLDDPGFGIVRTQRTAEVTGGSNPAGYVESKRGDGVGFVNHDKARVRAQGTFETRDPGQDGVLEAKVTRVRVRFTLTGGGPGVATTVVTGNFDPIIRQGGGREPFVLEEDVQTFALGYREPNDFPVPEPLSDPWVHDRSRTRWSPPEISEYGLVRGQHLWVQTLRRVYVWSGVGDPRQDDSQRRLLADQFLPDETIRTLSSEVA